MKQIESLKSCPACRSSARFFFNSKDINRNISTEDFSYYKCDRCFYIFLDPIPSDLGRYYPADYYGPPPNSVKDLEGAARIVEGYKIDLLKNHLKSGTLLEIGPSMGGFAVLAKAEGFEVSAIEMDKTCCKFLNEVAQIKTLHAENEIAALKTIEPVDAIAMWHVIEHLRDPMRLIRLATEKLKPGGVLVVAAPNPDALQFHIWGRAWVHVDAPRHVCLIPISLLQAELEKLGMNVELVTTVDKGALGWNSFGWEYSAANCFKNAKLREWAQKAGRVAARITGRIEERGQRGSAYTIIARKVDHSTVREQIKPEFKGNIVEAGLI